MIGLLTGVAAGIALGMISGLLPGVHVNMMAGGLLAVQTALIPVFGPEMIAAAMIAALVTHSFLDTIPSTFLVYLILILPSRSSPHIHSVLKAKERKRSGLPPWEVPEGSWPGYPLLSPCSWSHRLSRALSTGRSGSSSPVLRHT